MCFQKELQSWYRFLLPRDETFEHLFNKARFCTFAREHHLPVPQTIIINNVDELDSIVSSIRFPCIVKPAYRQDWTWETEELLAVFGPYKRSLRRFTSTRELIKFCNALPRRASALLIQSYIEGRDEAIISFHGYFDEQSRCLGYFLGRKIRTYPSHTGVSVYVQTIHNNELAQKSIGYLEQIRFQGIVKIDYKLDQDDNEFKILEINPRYNLWVFLRISQNERMDVYFLCEIAHQKEILPRVRSERPVAVHRLHHHIHRSQRISSLQVDG